MSVLLAYVQHSLGKKTFSRNHSDSIKLNELSWLNYEMVIIRLSIRI